MTIPNIIHQMWANYSIPDDLKVYQESIKTHHPSKKYVYMFWNDETINAFIKDNYHEFYERYNRITKNIIKADFARYAILYKFGGVYLDLDIEVYKNVFELFKKTSLYLCEEHPEHCKEFPFEKIISNWLIASPIQCTHLYNFMKLVLESHSNDPLHCSGPFMITKYLNTNNENVEILDYSLFGFMNKRQIWRLLDENKKVIQHKDSHGIHYYYGSWWKKKPTRKPVFTIITPTIGRRSLLKLKEQLKHESLPYVHLIMWDSKRAHDEPGGPLQPNEVCDENTFCYEINHPLYPEDVQKKTQKTPRMDVLLRAYGITMARSPYIKCMDDDTWPETDHLSRVLKFMMSNKLDFCHCYRKMWKRNGDCIGVDKFEAIGGKNKFGYTLLDNSSTFYNRKAANILCNIYLDYPIYGDDRLTYEPLMKYCSGKLLPDVLTNHSCQPHLETYFEQNCTV